MTKPNLTATSAKKFLLLDLVNVPEKTWAAASTLAEWKALMTDTTELPENFFSTEHPCPCWVSVLICSVIPGYFAAFNYLPVVTFLAFPVLEWRFGFALLMLTLILCLLVGNFASILNWYFRKKVPGEKRTLQQFHLEAQYHRERLTNIYFNKKYVVPASLLEPGALDRPCILCVAPHGVVPWGNCGAQSKLFGDRPTKWAAAPVLFKIPVLRPILQQYGAFPASKAGIIKCLSDGYNAGIVLDGIAGMFTEAEAGHETLAIADRKAICAIAIKAQARIVPGYCFGSRNVADVLQDPFGWMKALSIVTDVSLTPFIGRWGIPMGPPRPKPLLFAYGDALECGEAECGEAAVDSLHKQLLSAFTEIFEAHKRAYGWDGTMAFI